MNLTGIDFFPVHPSMIGKVKFFEHSLSDGEPSEIAIKFTDSVHWETLESQDHRNLEWRVESIEDFNI